MSIALHLNSTPEGSGKFVYDSLEIGNWYQCPFCILSCLLPPAIVVAVRQYFHRRVSVIRGGGCCHFTPPGQHHAPWTALCPLESTTAPEQHHSPQTAALPPWTAPLSGQHTPDRNTTPLDSNTLLNIIMWPKDYELKFSRCNILD